MQLAHHARALRRRWPVVVVAMVLGGLVGLAGGAVGRASKQASPPFFVAVHTFTSSDGTANVARDRALATEGIVVGRVAQRLGLASPEVLRAAVVIEARPDLQLLYVAGGDPDPARAAAIADTYAEEFVTYTREVEAKQREVLVAQADAQLESLRGEYDRNREALVVSSEPGAATELDDRQLELSSAIAEVEREKVADETAPQLADGLVTISSTAAFPASRDAFTSLAAEQTAKPTSGVESATFAATPDIDKTRIAESGDGVLARLLLGLLLGLLAGVAGVIVLGVVDPRITTASEAEDAFGLPVVAAAPGVGRRRRRVPVVVLDEPRSRAADAFRGARLAAELAAADSTRPTGSAGSPGRAAIAETLAGVEEATNALRSVLAQDVHELEPRVAVPDDGRGRVVLVASAGPREGRTTTVANLAVAFVETGARVLVVNCDFRNASVHELLGVGYHAAAVVATPVAGLDVIAEICDQANEANPGEVVRRQREVVRAARVHYDVVVLDSAPLVTTNDAAEVLSEADVVLVVARAGRTNVEGAYRAAELLRRRTAPVAGVVLLGTTELGRLRPPRDPVALPSLVEPAMEEVTVGATGVVSEPDATAPDDGSEPVGVASGAAQTRAAIRGARSGWRSVP